MQDILIRFRRMQGYEALWQPGTDHAAIGDRGKGYQHAEGSRESTSTKSAGREFLKYAWKWKEEYGSRIINQLHRLGPPPTGAGALYHG